MIRVEITPLAEAQITRIDGWWRENRRAAPDLFLDELADAFDLLARIPGAGRRHPHATVPELRRYLLRATRYHVYYARSADNLFVLAVWHAQRGIGPQLGEGILG